jgi:hypothetical protein
MSGTDLPHCAILGHNMNAILYRASIRKVCVGVITLSESVPEHFRASVFKTLKGPDSVDMLRKKYNYNHAVLSACETH